MRQEEPGASFSETVWTLGRSLLLLWLMRIRLVEPYFVSCPIRSTRMLAEHTLFLLSRYRPQLGGDHDRLIETCLNLVEQTPLHDRELYAAGLQTIDAALLQGTWSRRNSRYEHLRGFVLRNSRQTTQYDDHMLNFERRAAQAPSEFTEDYFSRLLYEQASALRFYGGDSREAIRLYREVNRRVRASEESGESSRHLLLGSGRNIVLAETLLENREDALEAWDQLREDFTRFESGKTVEDFVTSDNELLVQLRVARRKDGEWRKRLAKVPAALRRVLKKKHLPIAQRHFLRSQLSEWTSTRASDDQLPESKKQSVITV